MVKHSACSAWSMYNVMYNVIPYLYALCIPYVMYMYTFMYYVQCHIYSTCLHACSYQTSGLPTPPDSPYHPPPCTSAPVSPSKGRSGGETTVEQHHDVYNIPDWNRSQSLPAYGGQPQPVLKPAAARSSSPTAKRSRYGNGTGLDPIVSWACISSNTFDHTINRTTVCGVFIIAVLCSCNKIQVKHLLWGTMPY